MSGITERRHRTSKRIVASKKCSVQEAVYWFNISPKDENSASFPMSKIYTYKTRSLVLTGVMIVSCAQLLRPCGSLLVIQCGSGHQGAGVGLASRETRSSESFLITPMKSFGNLDMLGRCVKRRRLEIRRRNIRILRRRKARP